VALDLGGALGCFGHLGALTREQIGPWRDAGERTVVRGRDLFPWCPWRDLSTHDLARLRNGEALEIGDVHPASWALPQGFPDPAGPIRGYLDDGLHALLRERDGKLHASPLLKAPI
jgi:hypothetical protein